MDGLAGLDGNRRPGVAEQIASSSQAELFCAAHVCRLECLAAPVTIRSSGWPYATRKAAPPAREIRQAWTALLAGSREGYPLRQFSLFRVNPVQQLQSLALDLPTSGVGCSLLDVAGNCHAP